MELYCGTHDNVGCHNCGNIDHKLCKDMHYVPDVAVGIKATSEPDDVEDSLGSLVTRATRVKQTKEEDLRRVTAQRDTAVKNIKQRVDAIKQRLDDLKVAAIADVDMTLREIEQPLTIEINKSRDLISELEKEERRLKAAQTMGESDLFVYVKKGRARVREGEKIIQELEKSRGQSLRVAIDDTVLACVTGLETLVEVKVSRHYDLSLSVEQRPTIRMNDDKTVCSITDSCFLDDGNMVLTDWNNRCVKLFDKSYKALDRCDVQDIPTAVCVVGTKEVAITWFHKKTAQFATVDGMIRLTRFFSVGETCRAASFCNNRLLISCGGYCDIGEGPGQVRIYDTSGVLLQTMKHDNLDVPRQNMATRDGGCVVADLERGILVFDHTGKIDWQCQPADLKKATGLCEVDDRVLVCCCGNGHVFQVNPTDKSSNILLRGSSDFQNPRSLTYDMVNDKLIITKRDCDHMLVYKISRK